MNTEAELISAVCKNKDISTLLADNVDEIFTSHRDIWDGLKSYYYKFKAVPEAGVLIEKFKDFEVVETKAETGYYLVEVLQSHAKEAQGIERNRILSLASKSEISMMIPVVFLILPISILFALWPSLSNLNLYSGS